VTHGQCMRQARLEAGLRIRDLADKAGISYGMLQAMETDVRNPTILTAEFCADALGISVDEYIGHKVRKVKKSG